jgi:hypothetical protein
VGGGSSAPKWRENARQVVVAQLLAAKYQHVVPVPGLLDRFDLGCADAREVDSFGFGAQRPRGYHLQHAALL